MQTDEPVLDGEGEHIVLTGDRPTGKLHLGHLVGSVNNRIKLQDTYKQFLMIADTQALTDNADNPQKVHDAVYEVALGNLASGVDPQKTTIFIQSQVPALAELFTYFLNLVTVPRLMRNPTVKTEIQQKGFEESLPAGFLAYPVSQAADILGFKGSLVPVGEDQLPMIEQTNEIVEKFNRLYKADPPVFKKVRALVPDSGSRLPGIEGKAKMSKSLNNAIYLSDSPAEIEEKVMKMYTDPNHVHAQDPGQVEGNVVFTYLDVFDPDHEEVKKLKDHYKKGGLGDVEIKKRLIEVLHTILDPIRNRRDELDKDPNKVMDILKKGTNEANAVANKTLEEVKTAMKINYFA